MRLLKDSHGFTIIEMIAILLIIGVLSAVAISRVSATDTYSVAAEAETLKSHLRFAQARAMSHEDSWGISLTTNSYSLLQNGATAGATYKLPNENSATHTFQNGVSKTSGATIVVFDKWGRPVDMLGNPVTDPISITLSGSQTITITKNTGFIP